MLISKKISHLVCLIKKDKLGESLTNICLTLEKLFDHKYIMFCDSYDLIDESLVNLLSKGEDKLYRKQLQSSMNYFVEMKKRSFPKILYEKVVQLSKI